MSPRGEGSSDCQIWHGPSVRAAFRGSGPRQHSVATRDWPDDGFPWGLTQEMDEPPKDWVSVWEPIWPGGFRLTGCKRPARNVRFGTSDSGRLTGRLTGSDCSYGEVVGTCPGWGASVRVGSGPGGAYAAKERAGSKRVRFDPAGGPLGKGGPGAGGRAADPR